MIYCISLKYSLKNVHTNELMAPLVYPEGDISSFIVQCKATQYYNVVEIVLK